MQANRVGNGGILLLRKVLNVIFCYAESEDMVRRNYTPQSDNSVSGWREGKVLFWGSFGDLHRNCTDWEELQYDKRIK